MTDEELDVILSQQDSIAASSGFAESVMAALHSEASTPPPISFPWKRAIPGTIAAVVLLISGACLMLPRLTAELSNPAFCHLPPASRLSADNDLVSSLGWLFAALLLSLISAKLPMYLTRSLMRRR